MRLTDAEIEELGNELSARIGFEHDAALLVDKGMRFPPSDRQTVADSWVEVLNRQDGVELSCALEVPSATGPVKVIATRDHDVSVWEELFRHQGTSILPQNLFRHSAFRCFVPPEVLPGSEHLILVATPCAATTPTVALAVVAEAQKTALVHWMVDNAAVRAGTVFGVLTAAEQRERGLRDMAARVSHMCSTSVVLAQVRLAELLRHWECPEPIRDGVKRALNALEEAQSGFDRAALLGVPWSQFAENVKLGVLLADIAASLRVTTGAEVVREESLSILRRAIETVRASETRLIYAFRDLMLAVWLLGEPRAPIAVVLAADGEHVEIRFKGGRTNFEADDSGVRTTRLLLDPATFLISSDRYVVERIAGFHLASTLFAEVRGAFSARVLEDQRLELLVRLPLHKGGAEAE